MILFVLIVIMVALMMFGLPIAVSMGITAMGNFIVKGDWQILTMAGQRMFAGATGFTLLAVPFYIFAGILMNSGGITERIFRFARAVSGHWHGGLGQVNIINSLVFSGMSGTAVSDAAGFGAIEIKAMNDAGYDPPFSAAITAASSTIGPIIPPSVPFVVYASITGVSTGALFMAGVLPGFLMALAMIVAVSWISRRRKYPRDARASFRELVVSFLHAVPALLCVFIIIGGMASGLFTPTEAGAIACLYAIVLSVLIYREVSWKQLGALLWEAVKQTANVVFIIAVAGFFSWFLNYLRIPQMTISALLRLTTDRTVLLLLMLAIYLALGCFIEGTAIMYITVPIFLPILTQLGVNLVQFGVVTVLAMMIGMITPPVGVCLYATSSISGVPLWPLAREASPYVVGLVIVLLLVTFIPELTLWVPQLLGFAV